jgi:hypothetical protein
MPLQTNKEVNLIAKKKTKDYCKRGTGLALYIKDLDALETIESTLIIVAN